MILFPVSLLITALAATVFATMAPSYPDPGTIWTAGKSYSILWADDGTAPSINQSWTSFKIDFMTGSNDNQTFLTNVATGLDGSKISSYTWTAPNVDPYAAVYFFMFTNAAGESAWTTRFGIVAKDGDTLAAEPEKTQPNGQAIPWGNGHLASASAAATAAATSSSAVPSVASSPSAASASITLAQDGSGHDQSGTATAAPSKAAVATAADASSAVPFLPSPILTVAGIFLAFLITM
ncbi:hypothetical protein BX666DRAFT_1889237 [Dichotomocladium elegans]|nr:hypothetical protein BX666DRAFT_1889237 [Dichotomocladium elegans]